MNPINANTRLARRVPAFGTLLAAIFCSSISAHADVTPFVDNYQTHQSSNKTPAANAVLNLLSEYSNLWTPGSAWNTGAPTVLGAPVIRQNLQYVVNVTQNRTQAQADYAYLRDRRDQSYSAIAGLGDLAGAYKTGSGAYTTIADTVPTDATAAKYDDKGNGAGGTASTLGSVVTLVATLRGNYSSTTPPKNYFLSPRPWRLNDSGLVVDAETETTGYYTSTNADGTPNKTTALTFFPSYQSNVAIVPALKAVRSTTPASDGGFPSGHANAAYLASIALAYAVPQRFDSLLLNASEIANSHIVAGMHSPLEVIGGRNEATALAAAILFDPVNATIKTNALNQAQSYFSALLAGDTVTAQSDWVANKVLYTARLTYGLPSFGNTTLAASVPKGAEVLLETRLPYLDAAQRREVLRTTAIGSGNALDDAEGWNRLNLFAASGGFGRFDNTVTVNLDATLGGFNGSDYWRNDISGTGGLVKQGTGTLVLAGNNTYTGVTDVQGGTLAVDGNVDSPVTVESGATLEGSGVFNQKVAFKNGATLAPASSTITFANGLVFADGSAIQLALGAVSDEILVTDGKASGPVGHGRIKLSITATDGFGPGKYTLIAFTGKHASHRYLDADDFELTGTVAGYRYQLVGSHHALELLVIAIPDCGHDHDDHGRKKTI